MTDEDGDIFWDAVEAMDEDGCVYLSISSIPCSTVLSLTDCLLTSIQMSTDDPNTTLTPGGSRKRRRSPSPPLAIESDARMASVPSTPPSYVRQPKRQRKSKDVPAYDALPDAHVLKGMGKSNPLNRRVLKREAKRARRAGRVRNKAGGEGGGVGGGMEIDDDGLAFTFIA